MAYNLLLKGSFAMPFYTDLSRLFRSDGTGMFGGVEMDFDWLVTDLELIGAHLRPDSSGRPLVRSGTELTWQVESWEQSVQCAWGVFSAFTKGTAPEPDRLAVKPYADGNATFWEGSSRPQYPGAIAEVVCWDSSALLLISTDKTLAEKFKSRFPDAQDLDEHIRGLDRGSAG